MLVEERQEPSGGAQHPSGQVSIIQQVAIGIGSDHITIDASRANPLWLDGTAVTIAPGQYLPLAAGWIYATGGANYVIDYKTGEQVSVASSSVIVHLGSHPVGPIEGLLGNANGTSADDLQLADGTVLPQPIPFATLYGAYADAWRVTDANSLFDYGVGESTATFTNKNFPPSSFNLGSLPLSVLQQAQNAIAALGITDPVQQQNALLDYVLTGGDLGTAAGDAAGAQGGLTGGTVLVTTQAPERDYIGIVQSGGSVDVASSAVTVTFQVYRTGPTTDPVVVNYSVVPSGLVGHVTAAEYGGALQSGNVTIPAGQSTANISILTPAGLALPNELLDVQVNTTTPNVYVSSGTASASLHSTVPVEGIDAVPYFNPGYQNSGLVTQPAPHLTVLSLGTIGADGIAQLQMSLLNATQFSGDTLGGTFSASGDGFTFHNIGSVVTGLIPGSAFSNLLADVGTSLGSHSATLVFHPTESNNSGYTGVLPAETLTIQDTVIAANAAPAATPGTIDVFGRVNGPFSTGLTVGNTSSAGSDKLRVLVSDTGGHILPTATLPLNPGATTTLGLNNLSATGGTFTDALTIDYASIAPDASVRAALTPQASVTVHGTVYTPAVPSLLTPSLNFGTIHAGDPFEHLSISIANIVSGPLPDDLVIRAVNTGPFTSPLNYVTVVPGATGDIEVDLSSAQGGAFNVNGTFDLFTHDSVLTDVKIGEAVVNMTGTVVSFGTVSFLSAGGGAHLQGGGTNYTLDFGTLLSVSQAVTADVFGVNSATSPADAVSGTFDVQSPIASFSTNGFAGITGLTNADLQDLAGSIVFDPTAGSGVQTEQVVFTPTNGQPAETISVRGTIHPVTVASSGATYDVAPTSMLLGDVRVGGSVSQAITLSNYSALASGHNLSGTADVTTGLSTTGGIVNLAPQAADNGSVRIGLDTSTDGLKSGTATLSITDSAVGSVVGTVDIAASGRVFNTATAALAGTTIDVGLWHIGPINGSIGVQNTAVADGFSENLDAAFSGALVNGYLYGIAPGTTGAVHYTVSPAQVGAFDITGALQMTTDGNGVDRLGIATLNSVAIHFVGTAENYALPSIHRTSGDGTLSGGANNQYALNFGTITLGGPSVAADLSISNDAAGLADLLGASLNIPSGTAFTNPTETSFTGLGAGLTHDLAGALTFNPTKAGTFTETLQFLPTSDMGGTVSALSPISVNVEVTVLSAGPSAGDDSIIGTPGPDSIDGLGGDDTIIGLAGNDTLLGNTGDDSLDGGAGDDLLNGGPGDDTMVGGPGNDTFVVNSLGDVVVENPGSGTDLIETDLGNYVLAPGNSVENLTYIGSGNFSGAGNELDNVITGGAGDDSLAGNGGDDTLIGLGGDDTLAGGSGNDTYIVSSAGDVVNEMPGGGTDTILTTLGTYALTAAWQVENLTYTGNGAFAGTGNALANIITGGAGDDTLDGAGGGDDTLIGGAGNDTYIVHNSTDVVTELPGGGIDQVLAFSSYQLPDNVENLTLEGATSAFGWGNALSNVIIGNAGNNNLRGGGGDDTLIGLAGKDTLVGGVGDDSLSGGDGTDSLDGGTGDDTLVGGAGDDTLSGGSGTNTLIGGNGNDTYIVSSPTDMITELPNGGIDTVQASVNWTMAANLEVLMLTGGATSGQANDSGDTIIGNDLGNLLTGGLGDDSLVGGNGADSLQGGGGNDTLVGGNGDDTLSSGSGIDSMSGGAGNDLYYVNNSADMISEVAGGGYDTVIASVGYFLPSGVEDLTLTGNAGYGWGNDAANLITANDAGDKLRGGAGDDTLVGGAGDDSLYGGTNNDSLIGGAGDDTLDGGAGRDTMSGGTGNDTYYVDNPGDVVVEAPGAGIDTVIASLFFALPTNVENLTLTGAAISGWGNSGDNSIIGDALDNNLRGGAGDDTLDGGAGNDSIVGGTGDDSLIGGAGDDTLDGGPGADTMAGGTGDDTYYVNNVGDVVTEQPSQGHDTVLVSLNTYTLGANIETMQFIGSGDFAGTGNATANTIIGGSGDDTLDGGGGADTLTGGAGADTFFFQAGEAKGDTITDFTSGVDKLVFSGFGTVGASFLQLNSTDWRLIPAGGGGPEVIHFQNAANVSPTDFRFV